MKFTLDSRPDVNLIRGYAPGEVRIGETVLSAPCIISATRLISVWRPSDLDSVTVQDLAAVFALTPDVVLWGSGMKQIFPPAPIRHAFTAQRIGLEVMDLGAACRTYNILVQEDRRVAAVLFP